MENHQSFLVEEQPDNLYFIKITLVALQGINILVGGDSGGVKNA